MPERRTLYDGDEAVYPRTIASEVYVSDGSSAGAFRLYLSNSASYSGSGLGARLMYKHLAS